MYKNNSGIITKPKVNKYGKGNWNEDGKVISFFSDKEKDFDEKYTLDSSNSRARLKFF